MRILAMAALLVFSGTAYADANQPAPLWRTLAYGDTIADASAKLAAMPEVKRVSPRKDGLKVSLNGDGVAILGEQFQVSTEFADGKLVQVNMLAADTCANKIEARYARLLEALKEKYVLSTQGASSESDMRLAKLRATEQNPVTLPTVLGTDTNAVMVIQRFTRSSPPEAGYVSGKLARALSNYAWQMYESQRNECDGTGDVRVALMLAFMTRADLERRASEIDAADAAEIKSAAKDL